MAKQYDLKQLVTGPTIKFEQVAGPFPRPTAALAWLIDRVHQTGKGAGTVSYEPIPDSAGFDILVTQPGVVYQFLVEATEAPASGGVTTR